MTLTSQSISRPRGRSPIMASRLLWGLVGLGALYYLVTSLVVAVNGFVWLPSLPGTYYALERAMYWPVQAYFAVVYALLGRVDMPYAAYAALTRAPLVLAFGFILGLAARRLARKSH